MRSRAERTTGGRQGWRGSGCDGRAVWRALLLQGIVILQDDPNARLDSKFPPLLFWFLGGDDDDDDVQSHGDEDSDYDLKKRATITTTELTRNCMRVSCHGGGSGARVSAMPRSGAFSLPTGIGVFYLFFGSCFGGHIQTLEPACESLAAFHFVRIVRFSFVVFLFVSCFCFLIEGLKTGMLLWYDRWRTKLKEGYCMWMKEQGRLCITWEASPLCCSWASDRSAAWRMLLRLTLYDVSLQFP